MHLQRAGSVLAPRLVLAASVVAFALIGAWLSERVGAWSEEISTYPSGPNAVLAGAGEPIEASCAQGLYLRTSESRPILSLCAGGRTWPIMVAPYISGWIYWPFAALVPNDVFVLRKLGLVLGALTLLLCFRIASRVADPWVAAGGAVATAFASPFVLAHSLLVHYELTPLPLVLLAAMLLVGSGPLGVGRARAIAIGLAAGLAMAANIKAVFLLGALIVLAQRTGRLAALSSSARVTAIVAAVVPLLPMLSFALLDSRGGFSGQMTHRVTILVTRLTSPSILWEPLNLLTYWTDVAAYGDRAAYVARASSLLPAVLPAIALGRVAAHLTHALRGRPHDALAASMGALICGYLLVGALLYTQQPAANYAPLQAVFGFATGATAIAIARGAAQHFELSTRASAAIAVALVLLAAGGFAWNTLRRGDPALLPMSTNSVAQRAAVRYLEQHAGAPVVTATYNIAGVVDSISRGRVETIQLAPSMWRCEEGGEPRACLERRWTEVVSSLGPVRLLVPARLAVSDEREAAEIVPVLEALAARGTIRLEREATFRGVATPPLLALYRLGPVTSARDMDTLPSHAPPRRP